LLVKNVFSVIYQSLNDWGKWQDNVKYEKSIVCSEKHSRISGSRDSAMGKIKRKADVCNA